MDDRFTQDRLDDLDRRLEKLDEGLGHTIRFSKSVGDRLQATQTEHDKFVESLEQTMEVVFGRIATLEQKLAEKE